MSVFPKLGKINDVVFTTIQSRKDSNVEVSKLISWIRVASAVENEYGTGLILESIPTKQTFASTYGSTNKSGRVGTTFNKTDVFAENDRGYRPSPVIENLNVQNGNHGLSRKATFTIKCFTLAQAEILTKYFYQPGYCVLVEYGWNTTKSMEHRADLSKDGACEIARYNNYSYITQKREKSLGTYDGFMGRVTGGGYKNGDGETYVIDVELTTLGEIPTYLQVHKGGIDAENIDEVDSSLRYNVSEIKDSASNTLSIGLGLFQMVYNKLPNEKRSRRVKGLTASESDFGKDVNNIPYINERNFINVDETMREILLNNFKSLVGTDLKTRNNDGTVQSNYLPEGAPLISEHSYIRLELAFRILNEYAVSIERTDTRCSGNVKSYSYLINTNDTIIGAHKWMFSIDGSKLFIPNENHPKFGLAKAFSTTDTSNEPILRPALLGSGDATSENSIVDDLNPWKGSGVNHLYAFPSTQVLEPDTTDKDIIPQTAKAHQWGYLRNLYINLDFFIEVLSRSNYVLKDILFELLNGMSAAAGSQWQFDLAEVPHETRKGQSTFDYEIKVVDRNFIGGGDLTTNQITKFYSKGVDTPFLSSDLSMPIPSEMRNRILGRYNSAGKVETNTEGSDDDFALFFERKLDPVSEILNSFKKSTTPDPPSSKVKSASTDEIQKANYDIFMSKATVVPKKQDRKAKLTSVIDDHLMVVAWEDSKLLKQVAKRFGKILGSGQNKAYSQILSIDFTFTIHGVSGLKVGDIFQIIDLPSQFKNGVFQIMEQSHDLSDGLWITTITAKMRNFQV